MAPSSEYAVGRTELWVADVTDAGALEHARQIAGGVAESIYQPGWSPEGTLYYVSDRSGYWHLYRTNPNANGPRDTHVTNDPNVASAEFGRPQWVFGTSTWQFAGPSRLVTSYTRKGHWHLAIVDPATGALTDIAPRLAEQWRRQRYPRGRDCRIRHATTPWFAWISRLARWRRRRGSTLRSMTPHLGRRADRVRDDRREQAHAFYYAPRSWISRRLPANGLRSSSSATGTDVGRPPTLDLQIPVLDEPRVCSRRRELSRQFGLRPRLPGATERQVGNCRRRRRHLRDVVPGGPGKADAHRAVIRGGSAGGYTTLAALTFHPEVFKAGASYYGVSDLEVLEIDTHKFESRYSHSLVAPYPAARAIYRERSPIHAIDRLACPLILFQGLEDKVVPPNQSQMMADAVRAKGLPVAYLAFEGEQHGFRKAETIIRCLEAELYFYGAVFGFTPADRIPPVPIDNLR